MAKDNSILSTMREIGRDLLNIEVNTIEKPNLAALKMPTLPHALLDIAATYIGMLTEKLDLTSFWDLPRQLRPKWQPEFNRSEDSVEWKQLKITTGPETFDKLRWVAVRALSADDTVPENQRRFEDSERVILYRIRRNCDQLKNIIYDLRKENSWKVWLNEKTRLDLLREDMRYQEIDRLPVDYATTVRKIWDMGVESVLMQTIIQIDGDVITRIQAGMEAAKQERMLNVHRCGIDVSLKHWQTFFDIIKQIAGSLTALFLPRLRK